MMHHRRHRKLSREAGPRLALLRSLAEGLIVRGKIKTTEARAKELRRFIEPLVTKARTGTLASRRYLISSLGTAARAEKLFKDIAPRYVERPGGYTRVIKMAPRISDGARQAVIEFV
jgi:large subunit ribosomal protein L17